MTNIQSFQKQRNRIGSQTSGFTNQKDREFRLPLFLIALHLPIGIALYNAGALSIVHPYAAFFIGLHLAIKREEKIERVALAAAYIVGSEVLWRMAEVPIFWEFGKYGAAAIMLVALIRRGFLQIPILPLLYFLFLTPACILAISDNDLLKAKDVISFNISGPFLLFVSCWFFSYVRVNLAGLQKLLFAIILPLLSVAITTLFYTVTTTEIAFNTESNFATSGGFGPNQVSAMLGLGAFLCLSIYLLLPLSFTQRIIFGILLILFLGQSVLTFSRGGLYGAVGATLAIIIVQMKNPNTGIKRILPVLGIALLFLVLIFPFLNDFTGGNLQTRFEDSEPTHRVEIMEADYQIFLENPIFGVGVGEARQYRAEIIDLKAASHTEFSRILSEHGFFGILSLTALIAMCIFNFQRQKSEIGKALVVGVIVWSALFMTNAGMRLAAPSLIWGLSFITLLKSPQIIRRNQHLAVR